MPSIPPPDTVPRALTVVIGAVLLEALALAVAAVGALVVLLRGGSTAPGVVLAVALFSAAVAAVLVLGARGLLAGRRWSRGPVITWQLLQGATAVTVLQAVGSPWAWAALGLAALVVVLLMTRAVVASTTRR